MKIISKRGRDAQLEQIAPDYLTDDLAAALEQCMREEDEAERLRIESHKRLVHMVAERINTAQLPDDIRTALHSVITARSTELWTK